MLAASSCDHLLGGRVRFYQPIKGYRAAMDGVMLASCLPRVTKGRVLELGVGTGMAGLCFLARLPKAARVDYVGLEKQPRLVAYSRWNFRVNGFATQARIVVGDMRLAHPCLRDGSFDLVFVNPPWHVHKDKGAPQDKERAVALFLGQLRLQDWLYGVARRVKRGGSLAFIIDGRQEQAAQQILFRLGGWHIEHSWRLFAYQGDKQAKRVVVLAGKSTKTHKRRGGGVSPLVLHDGTGLTPAAEGMLRARANRACQTRLGVP
ncbi:MAG: methyltransferase [Alphaproteobacteria bacterium GM202ARS2]|nr:methyltransferase [Alphaproteobacteria bacterium GM202ARS2]